MIDDEDDGAGFWTLEADLTVQDDKAPERGNGSDYNEGWNARG